MKVGTELPDGGKELPDPHLGDDLGQLPKGVK
jgi:hypothetical protein